MAKEKTKWQIHLMDTWNKMKAKDKNSRFSNAMKEAAKTFKK